jgi:hypothetical protein
LEKPRKFILKPNNSSFPPERAKDEERDPESVKKKIKAQSVPKLKLTTAHIK